MPIPNTPVPQYPNVPQSPGVPPLSRSLQQGAQIQNEVVLLGADAISVLQLLQPSMWGLFTQDGVPAFQGISASPLLNNLASGVGLSSQAVGEFEFRKGYRMATAPQEEGAFLSYNKVSVPFDGRVTYIVTNLLSSGIAAFVQQVSNLAASLELLDLVMPEFVFPSCNITHWDFRRSARRGLTMLMIDIWVEEVRVIGTTQFSSTNTAAPSGANPVNGGTVQGEPTGDVPGGAPT